MTDPPLVEGASQEITDCPVSPVVADTFAGAPGREAVVTEEEAEDALEVPTPLVAVTVNVYAVPSDKPVTVQEVEVVAHVWPPLEVTV